MEAYSLHLPDTYNSTHRQRTRGEDPRELRKLGKKNQGKTLFFQEHEGRNATAVMPAKKGKRAKGTVGDGAAGKKAKATEQAGGQCVSEKSQDTRTSKNVFEKSNSKTQYFVKGRRRMVLSSSSGGVTFLLTKMIRGSLSLIYQVQNT